MIYGSVCSGIEAATVAWHPLGWRAAFFAEIDKQPSAVLAHHYPGVPNLGDFTKIKKNQHDPIDILVGGTPCQSFSLAGLRKGLGDDRGNLALEYLRLADRQRPRWLVWENVPGVLSSHEGRDFGSILGGMVELGYGVAYRVLDAQYVRVDGFWRAVPQRRRRVFVVGYLGDWRRAAAVLFERASLLGNSTPSRKKKEDVAGPLGGSAQSGGFRTTDLDNQGAFIPEHRAYGGNNLSGAIDVATGVRAHGRYHGDFESETFIAFGCKDSDPKVSSDIAPTLRGMSEDNGHQNGGGQIAIAFCGMAQSGSGWAPPSCPTAENFALPLDATRAQVVAIQERAICENPDAGPDGVGVRQDGAAYTLESRTVTQAVAFESRFVRNGRGAPEEICPPLKAQSGETGKGDASPLVAMSFKASHFTRGKDGAPSDVWPPLSADADKADQDPLALIGHNSRWVVRRLTPRECERLQGFPDDYTLVPFGKKEMADGPRYKMIGNSMAVNVMRWIGQRIKIVEGLS